MRFHAIMFVRDEDDIIAESLEYNSRWCDHIYVFDTGSTDNTWEIVLESARKLKQVVPVRREVVWWHDGLRAMVFEQFRSQSDDGDWWVRLDADEFYHVSPREFVARLRPYESSVYHAYYNFKLTVEEAARYEAPGFLVQDRARSIADRRPYYVPQFDYSEPRFFRYRRAMKWNPPAFAPFNAGFVARRRIPIRHYPHRDPQQMERRFRLRHKMLQEMGKMDPNYASHWQSDWQSELVPANSPGVLRWDPAQGDLLPCQDSSHLPGRWRRSLQFAIHFATLPALDRLRPPYPRDFQPTRLPSDVQASLMIDGSI